MQYPIERAESLYLLPVTAPSDALPYLNTLSQLHKRRLLGYLHHKFTSQYVGCVGDLSISMVAAETDTPPISAGTPQRPLHPIESGISSVFIQQCGRELPELFGHGIASKEHDGHPLFPAVIPIVENQLRLPQGDSQATSFAKAMPEIIRQVRGHQILGFYAMGTSLYGVLPYQPVGSERTLATISDDVIAFCRTLDAAPRPDHYIPAAAPNVHRGI